jgi:2-oxoisovalerate dehydrogenase E2 component (dihydrolipoyl transacylase)
MTDVRMPKLGESVTAGAVSRWLKMPGDAVALREPLLEISTDKIDTEIPSPAAGTLLEVLVAEGETVAVGTVLARIGERVAGVPEESVPAEEGSEASAPVGSVLSDNVERKHTIDAPTSRRADALKNQHTDLSPHTPGRTYLSPVVQKIAAEHAIDLAKVAGTGLGGRITKKDLLALLGSSAPPQSAQESTPQTQELTPLSAMRRAIAQHVSQSVRVAPHVATIFEVDMSRVVRHREAERATALQRGIRLTYSAYFIYAVAQALRRHPLVNDRYTDRGIVHNAGIHIGVAVALGKDGADGLLAPVLRHADEMTLFGVARALGERTERARAGQLLPDDLQGGTFTITNHGVGGSLIGTPIIVQPQSAILGVGAIVKRAIVKSAANSLLPSADDAIVIRPICYLTLSFDHRILDGASADAFLRDVQYQLETFEISLPE